MKTEYKAILTLRDEGFTFVQIAEKLNEKGFRTKNAKDFTPDNVRKIHCRLLQTKLPDPSTQRIGVNFRYKLTPDQIAIYTKSRYSGRSLQRFLTYVINQAFIRLDRMGDV